MKIDTFIKEYNESTNKDSYLKQIITTSYIKYSDKIDDCNKIVKVTLEREGIFKINTPARYMLFMVNLITRYTMLEYDNDDIVGFFETLDKNNLINKLLEYIPEREYKSYSTILEMCQDDYMENNRSLVGYIDAKVNALNLTSNAILDVLEQFNLSQNEESN